jgi:hypothetical protein
VYAGGEKTLGDGERDGIDSLGELALAISGGGAGPDEPCPPCCIVAWEMLPCTPGIEGCAVTVCCCWPPAWGCVIEIENEAGDTISNCGVAGVFNADAACAAP